MQLFLNFLLQCRVALTLLIGPAILLAEQAPTVNCNRTEGITQCEVHLAARQVLDVFELANPRRLVVDLQATTSQAAARTKLSPNLDVKAVRSAAHPDKFRLVFDISETAGQLAWRSSGEQVLIRFSGPIEVAEPLPPAEVRAALAPEPAPPELPRVVEPDPEPVALSVEVPPVSDAPGPGEQVCSHIEFLEAAGTNPAQIVLNFNKYPAFSFSRASSRTYRLKVQEARLADSRLMRPFFPPHSFPGIAYVELQENADSGLVVNIGVERGTNLKALARNDAVLVQVIE